jgi:hypothetical protein
MGPVSGPDRLPRPKTDGGYEPGQARGDRRETTARGLSQGHRLEDLLAVQPTGSSFLALGNALGVGPDGRKTRFGMGFLRFFGVLPGGSGWG